MQNSLIAQPAERYFPTKETFECISNCTMVRNHSSALFATRVSQCHIVWRNTKKYTPTQSLTDAHFVARCLSKGATFVVIKVIHLLQKDFQCSYCDERFGCKEQAKNHERKHHTNELNYECSICGRKFVSKNVMTEHIKSSHWGRRRRKVSQSNILGTAILLSVVRVDQLPWKK